MQIAGSGFHADISAMPASIIVTSGALSGIGFSTIEYDEPGYSDVAVSGIQIGAVASDTPDDVLIDSRLGARASAGGALVVRTPGSDASSRWTSGFRSNFLHLSAPAVERIIGAPLASVKCDYGVFALDGDTRIRPLMAALAADAASPAPSDPLFIESISLAILRCVTVPAASGQPSRRPATLTAVQAETLRSFIVSRSDGMLGLSELAEVVGMSEGHLVRAFKGAFGVTPYQYVLRARVEAAKTLMRGGALTLRDVARLSGFTDQSQMSRTFRRLTGRRPSDFDERHEAGAGESH